MLAAPHPRASQAGPTADPALHPAAAPRPSRPGRYSRIRHSSPGTRSRRPAPSLTSMLLSAGRRGREFLSGLRRQRAPGSGAARSGCEMHRASSVAGSWGRRRRRKGKGGWRNAGGGGGGAVQGIPRWSTKAEASSELASGPARASSPATGSKRFACSGNLMARVGASGALGVKRNPRGSGEKLQPGKDPASALDQQLLRQVLGPGCCSLKRGVEALRCPCRPSLAAIAPTASQGLWWRWGLFLHRLRQ